GVGNQNAEPRRRVRDNPGPSRDIAAGSQIARPERGGKSEIERLRGLAHLEVVHGPSQRLCRLTLEEETRSMVRERIRVPPEQGAVSVACRGLLALGRGEISPPTGERGSSRRNLRIRRLGN